MNSKEFEKRRKSIWAKHERDYGSLIAQKVRDRIEEELRVSSDEERTLEDLDGYLGSFIPIWKILLKDGQSAAGDSAKAKPQKRYRKCFERRFYLVNFVLDKHYKRGTRIDWKCMVAEWNKAHPSDTMALPTLRVEYQRAIKEGALMFQVFINRISRYEQTLAGIWRPLKKELENMASNTPSSFVLASVVGQKLWSDFQPLILALNEAIRNSPLFTEAEAYSPESVARGNSELEVIKNIGNIKDKT
jgi:hypothetical protein